MHAALHLPHPAHQSVLTPDQVTSRCRNEAVFCDGPNLHLVGIAIVSLWNTQATVLGLIPHSDGASLRNTQPLTHSPPTAPLAALENQEYVLE